MNKNNKMRICLNKDEIENILLLINNEIASNEDYIKDVPDKEGWASIILFHKNLRAKINSQKLKPNVVSAVSYYIQGIDTQERTARKFNISTNTLKKGIRILDNEAKNNI